MYSGAGRKSHLSILRDPSVETLRQLFESLPAEGLWPESIILSCVSHVTVMTTMAEPGTYLRGTAHFQAFAGNQKDSHSYRGAAATHPSYYD